LLTSTGWIHIKGQRTAYTNYYKKMKEGDADQWPPKFWKFCLETKDPGVKVAFTDPRRLGRVRLVDCPGKEIRQHSPLVENGPDPVVDLDRFTEEYLRKKMKARHVPIKALLLDQTTLSGIGNWVGDEVLYQAKLHPEQYCNEFNDEQIKQLFKAIRYVCQVSVDKLGDSDQFPKDWMFHYRWNTRPSAPTSHLPNGEKLAFLKVGGRTSCYAPNVQKKSGHIAPGVKEEPIVSDAEPEMKKKTAKSKAKQEVKSEDDEDEQPRKKKMKTEMPVSKKVETTETKKPKKQVAVPELDVGGGRRRSGRLGGRSA
jgi:formamidopyrimidine-DNA glycosylase